jgi:hypothetical protein
MSNEWTVPHAGFVANLATQLCDAAPDMPEDQHELSDEFVVVHEIFGIEMTYKRQVNRVETEIVDIIYMIFTPQWSITSTFNPTSRPTLEEISARYWSGSGDFDRWIRDAVLLKMAGVGDG